MEPVGPNDRETWLLRTANAQHGLLRHAQLLEAGLSAEAVKGRVRTRRLTRVHAGVYAFGHTALVPEGCRLAAFWAFDHGVVLSHWTAAAFHGWRIDPPDDDVHLSTRRDLGSRAGITVHRTRHLDRVDVHRAHPVAVTTIPRTLVDLADVMDWGAYRALADAQPRLHVDRIAAAQARTPKRRGAPLVTRLIEADDAHTKSELERRFLRFLDARGLPRPAALNERLAGHKADCLYHAERLVVELDGRAFHERRAQMRADRHRDADYQLAGYRILRLVWDDLHPDEAARTAEQLRRMLAAGGPQAPRVPLSSGPAPGSAG